MTNRVYESIERADFPLLGWLVSLRDTPFVQHGKDVELLPSGIVEGCWDGPFADGAFLGANNFFGSGMTITNKVTYFSPPSHTMDGLFLAIHRGDPFVSNSLWLLFREIKIKIEEKHPYTSKIATRIFGIDDYSQLIFDSSESKIYRILYDDFYLVEDQPNCQRRSLGPSITSFSDYQEYLLKVLKDCVDNAQSIERKQRYHLLTSCSSGYDSSAASALAAKVGCRQAVTLRSARGGADDSGKPVADQLGLSCVERPRLAPDERIVEFLISGGGGTDYPMAAFADELPRTVFFSGCAGDLVWGVGKTDDRSLANRGRSGDSLSEFRLRLGFFHIPTPIIAARRRPEIAALNDLDELQPYRIGGTYDRPIPRAIVEKAGVSRNSFGQQKNAVATILFLGHDTLSPELNEDFVRFVDSVEGYRHFWLRNKFFHAGYTLYRMTMVLGRRFAPLQRLSALLAHRFSVHEQSPHANMLFVWAMKHHLKAPNNHPKPDVFP
jgi:hypothetical protein